MSHLKAHFEESDSRVGKREEGSGTEITLIDDTVHFDYEVKEIHPDILGLLCLVTFSHSLAVKQNFPSRFQIDWSKRFRTNALRKKEV